MAINQSRLPLKSPGDTGESIYVNNDPLRESWTIQRHLNEARQKQKQKQKQKRATDLLPPFLIFDDGHGWTRYNRCRWTIDRPLLGRGRNNTRNIETTLLPRKKRWPRRSMINHWTIGRRGIVNGRLCGCGHLEVATGQSRLPGSLPINHDHRCARLVCT